MLDAGNCKINLLRLETLLSVWISLASLSGASQEKSHVLDHKDFNLQLFQLHLPDNSITYSDGVKKQTKQNWWVLWEVQWSEGHLKKSGIPYQHYCIIKIFSLY